MTKNAKIIAGVIVILVAGVIAYVGSRPKTDTYTPPPTATTGDTSGTATGATAVTGGTTAGTSTTGGTTAPSTYTLTQIATHNSGTSCWTTINGGVYDVTTWINQHPGGPQAILSLCGKDGSSAFNGQHGGQARPASELASFKIGTLAQ